MGHYGPRGGVEGIWFGITFLLRSEECETRLGQDDVPLPTLYSVEISKKSPDPGGLTMTFATIRTHRRGKTAVTSKPSRLRRILAGGTALSAATAACMFATTTSAVAGSSPEFDAPSGLAMAGGELWVTNKNGNSVTEIDPANGSLVSILSGASYGFDKPIAITSAGSDLFIANRGSGGSVTEINPTTGAAVKVISGSQFDFDKPVAITASGSTLLVLNKGNVKKDPSVPGSITEIDASTGDLIQVISGSSYAFKDPVAVAVSGPNAFVADHTNNAVTEVVISGGSLERVITGGGLDGPDGVGVSSGYAWVSNSVSSAATQINASTGAIVGTYSNNNGQYGFGSPSVVVGTTSNVYIASPFGSSPMVTDVNATSANPYWYECDTNSPDPYFSLLSALAVDGNYLWVASRSGANNPYPDAATGSLTEIELSTGTEVLRVPSS